MSSNRSTRASAAMFLFGAGTCWSAGNVGPVTTPIASEFSIGLTVVGLLAGTVLFGGLVVGKSIVTRLSVRTSVDRAARIACISSAAGNLIIAISPGLAGLFAGRFVAGIGMGLALVLGPAIANEIGGARLVGVFGAGVTLGIAGALGLGSILRDIGADWRWSFAISALLSVSALPFLPARSGVPTPSAVARGLGRKLLRHPAGWRLSLLFTAVLGIPYALGAWLIHFLIEVDGIAVGAAGILAFASYGLIGALREIGARLERPSRTALLTGVAPLVAAAGLLLLAAGSSATAIPAVVLIAAGFGLPYATMYEEAERSFPDAPVAAIAFFTIGGNYLPFIVVPLVGSALSNGNGGLAFALLGGVIALAGLANLRPADRTSGATSGR